MFDLSSYGYAAVIPDVVWVGKNPWRKYGRMLVPLTGPHSLSDVDRGAIRKAIREHNMLLACWTSDWDKYDESEWWWIACDDRDYDLTRLTSAQGKKKIKRGLKNCEVRQLEIDEFLCFSYPIYKEAQIRYGLRPLGKTEYCELHVQESKYPGRHYWGAFYQGHPAAYLDFLIIDGMGFISSGASDFSLKKLNCNSALDYTVTRHYLNQGLNYVTNGWRPLLHQTNIYDHLKSIGYRKVFCRANIELSIMAEITYRSLISRWGHHVGLQKITGKIWNQLMAFDRLVRISETFGVSIQPSRSNPLVF